MWFYYIIGVINSLLPFSVTAGWPAPTASPRPCRLTSTAPQTPQSFRRVTSPPCHASTPAMLPPLRSASRARGTTTTLVPPTTTGRWASTLPSCPHRTPGWTACLSLRRRIRRLSGGLCVPATAAGSSSCCRPRRSVWRAGVDRWSTMRRRMSCPMRVSWVREP